MRIRNIIDLVDKLFYGDIDKIYIKDTSEREDYKLTDLQIKDISKYDIEEMDGIRIVDDIIFLVF